MVAGEAGLRRRTSRAVRITLLLLGVYVACWTPYNVGLLWRVMDSASYARFESVLAATNSLVVATAIVNPFIYGRFERTLAPRRPQMRHRLRTAFIVVMFSMCL